MSKRVEIGNLRIDEELYALVRDEIAPDTGVDAETLWTDFGKIVHDLAPKNRALLNKRSCPAAPNRLRGRASHCGKPFNLDEYKTFLEEIGYLVPEGGDFRCRRAKRGSRNRRRFRAAARGAARQRALRAQCRQRPLG